MFEFGLGKQRNFCLNGNIVFSFWIYLLVFVQCTVYICSTHCTQYSEMYGVQYTFVYRYTTHFTLYTLWYIVHPYSELHIIKIMILIGFNRSPL